MYAIAFDLDQAMLKDTYHNASYQNAYGDIKKALEEKGFTRQQGSVYFGGPEMTAVKCVLAAQALSRDFPWFKPSVSDIRMLRIEEMNDLSEALL
ncbi:virulence factor [Pseudomonas putida]|uniref:virulence factor n=2 Tax=Pseudomonas TaxID=286 RepID=UPI0006D45D19|nr:virulence factor [Pseudomonas sp.]PEI09310.1 virulence factor [Pseudomonas putida]